MDLKWLFIIAVSGLALNCWAAPVCTEMSSLTSGTARANFDGSFTYTDPRVFVDGKFVKMIASSGDGFCKIQKKSLVVSNLAFPSTSEKYAEVNSNGNLTDYDFAGNRLIIDSVICR